MTENETSGVSRRTVTKAMAWAVPAVAVAATVPLAAASPCNDYNPENPCPVTFTGLACKEPGNPKFYRFQLIVSNPTGSPLLVTFDSLNVNGVTKPVDPTSTTVPAHTQRTITIRGGLYADSANGTATLNYTAGGVSGSTSTNFGDLPPVQNPSCPLDTFPYQSDQPL